MTENQKKIQTPECGYYLNQIYFYLTQGCNLKCRHCWIAPKYQTEETVWPSLDFELFKDIVRQGMDLGLSGVKLTGGEPLIHPDIERILDHINETGLRLTIETNGVKCSPQIAEKIMKNPRPFVSVSLDAPDAETHEWVRGVPGCFDAALEGVRNLVRAGLRPQIIMSVMRRNADRIEALVKLAEKEHAESVKFNLVTPTARGEQMQKSGETLSIRELIDLGEWVENTLKPASGIRVVYSHPTAFRPLGRIFTKPDGRCGIFGIIGVLGNGKYALCGIGETVPDLVFGEAGIDRLAEVWNHNPVLDDIRRGLAAELKGICADCLMKNMCLGSCVAMNYYRSKDLFAPNWYCDLAHEAGLFPASRIRPGSVSEYGG